MDDRTVALWTRFRDGGCSVARERIVESHLPLVRSIAMGIHRKTGEGLELEDLVHAGCIGLLKAVDSFDPERGFAFSTYAVPRIRGAIKDDLRKQDHGTRLGRSRMRMVATAEKELAARNGSMPSALETAERLEVDLETVWMWRSHAHWGTAVSLDKQLRYGGHEGPTLGEVVAGTTAADIENGISLGEDKRRLAVLIGELADRERAVLQLYYYEGLKLRQIGEVLGVTEARISQIRTGALARLRDRFLEHGRAG